MDEGAPPKGETLRPDKFKEGAGEEFANGEVEKGDSCWVGVEKNPEAGVDGVTGGNGCDGVKGEKLPPMEGVFTNLEGEPKVGGGGLG